VLDFGLGGQELKLDYFLDDRRRGQIEADGPTQAKRIFHSVWIAKVERNTIILFI